MIYPFTKKIQVSNPKTNLVWEPFDIYTAEVGEKHCLGGVQDGNDFQKWAVLCKHL